MGWPKHCWNSSARDDDYKYCGSRFFLLTKQFKKRALFWRFFMGFYWLRFQVSFYYIYFLIANLQSFAGKSSSFSFSRSLHVLHSFLTFITLILYISCRSLFLGALQNGISRHFVGNSWFWHWDSFWALGGVLPLHLL